MQSSYKLTKYACYTVNVAMAAVCNISPMFFETFHTSYGISYSLLGLLVLINFTCQLTIDLIFSFFSRHFNLPLTVKLTPCITVVGLLIYSIAPLLNPEHAYLWLVLGTMVFSVSAGLSEVLISPVIAAIPAENPEREMSKLHAVYAWGFVAVVLVSSVFLKLAGRDKWYLLSLLWAIVPLTAALLFFKAPFPNMKTGLSASSASSGRPPVRLGFVLMFVACIFLGGAAENTMSQWCSGFAETALGMDKFWGDVCGMALFAAALGTGRTLYTKYGKKIFPVLLCGFAGSVVTFLTAGLSGNAAVGLVACALTGFAVSMLWPGTLIYTEQNLPDPGVTVYAMLAAGGDLGGSVAPQLLGIVTDSVSASRWASELSEKYSMLPDQIGMRVGMILSAVFPLAGVFLVLAIRNAIRKQNSQKVSGREG